MYRKEKTIPRGTTDMIFEKTITVPADTAKLIDRYIGVNPTSEDDCLSIDETIRYTADFDNGVEVDVKCCGVDYDDGPDAINTAWTEAVLFENGYEQDNIFGEDEFFCDWEFEYDENEYIVHVIREGGTDSE